MKLQKELLIILNQFSDLEPEIIKEYEERIKELSLTKDENPVSHFCAYFLPFNPDTKEVMLGHHIKSGKWLSPGGHIDKDESLLETLNREIDEELGVKNFFSERPDPFLITITNIEHDPRPCKKHFDIWHLMKTDGRNFNIDMAEYHEIKWLPIAEAKKIATDAANQLALSYIEQNKF